MIKEEVNSKYTFILAKGRELFWKYGFKKVSVQEICKEAGISKMTYYKFFANKAELAKAVFDQEANQSVKAFRNIIEEKNSPPEKIMKLIAMKQEGASGISKEFLTDFYSDDKAGIKIYIEEKTNAAWGEMLNDFKKAQRKGIFRKDLKPEFFLYFSQKAGEMLSDERLLKLYKRPQELVAEFSNFFAFGISPHK
jgi:AcrR family transcriptional regulator